ncbi:MAG: hypothetical protein MZU95_15925 [Desulfomicrobium escambiense]|nr:hypothetical protein [Desulfomicrobium escambiense]
MDFQECDREENVYPMVPAGEDAAQHDPRAGQGGQEGAQGGGHGLPGVIL